MSNPEEPTTPVTPNTPDETAGGASLPTSLPPASELPKSAPLASEPFTPANEPFTPAATQALPPVDPNAATQVFSAPDQAAPADFGAPQPPVGPGAPYGTAPQPGQQAPMNTLALVAFIGSFFVGLVGIICGHISLKQIKRDGTRGRGFALAGTIIGYVTTISWIIAIIAIIVGGVAAAGLASAASDEFTKQLENDSSSEITETPSPDSSDDSSAAAGESSEEFCAAVSEIASLPLDDPAATSAAYERLAGLAPTAKGTELYGKLAELTLDPSTALNDPNFDLTAFTEELTETLTADSMSCY